MDQSDSGNLSVEPDRSVRVYYLTPAEIAERYGPTKDAGGDPRPRWRANRQRNQAAGLDRFGRPLPRIAGTNPRALDGDA